MRIQRSNGMARVLCGMLMSATLFTSMPAMAQQKMTGAAAEIDKTLRACLAAWATLDPEKAAPFYAKDAGNVYFDIAPLKYTGWSEYAAGTKNVFADFSALSITLNDDLMIHPAGDWAWATATVNMEATMKDGSKMPLDTRWTGVLEKRAKQWLIVHEHVSAPLPPPTAAPSK
jgi:ketosteroid isomerase-like protein